MAEQRKFVPTARTIRIGTMDEDNQGKAGGGGGGGGVPRVPGRSKCGPSGVR